MIDPSDRAFPSDILTSPRSACGMDLRTYLAAHAPEMPENLAQRNPIGDRVDWAVDYADALITRLNQPPNGPDTTSTNP